MQTSRCKKVKLFLDEQIAKQYKSASQKIRRMSEAWAESEVYCPNCGGNVSGHANNKPVADFYCKNCKEDFELKSKKGGVDTRIMDGNYRTMLERLSCATNPSFFFLSYDAQSWSVTNFLIIPKHFFTSEIILKRPRGLKDRPDYIMCDINLESIPSSGKIYYIKDGYEQQKAGVLQQWQKTEFLREQPQALRGWTLDVLKCIDLLKKQEFTLDEVYAFDQLLSDKHPQNMHVRDKIRQQLQLLHDKGYLDFVSKGVYRMTP